MTSFIRLSITLQPDGLRSGSPPGPVASGVPSAWADLDRLCARG